jgi:taurine dioxygenase
MAQPQRKSAARYPFTVTPLHPSLGAEITGITLADAVAPPMFAHVYDVFLAHKLILFRDVELPPATQVAFARNFGEVQVHVLDQYHGYKDHPEIYMLSNLGPDGRPSGKHPDRGTLYWHTDGSWRERTGQATMMYSEIVPPPGEGGETQFADMVAGYANLPAAIRAKIDGRRAIHNFDFSRTRPPRRGPADGRAEGQGAAGRASDSCAPIRRPARRRSSSATTPNRSRACPTTRAAR